MQIGSFKPYSLRHDTLGVINRINSISQFFRNKNQFVIFIQHDGTKENCFIPGSGDWQIYCRIFCGGGGDNCENY